MAKSNKIMLGLYLLFCFSLFVFCFLAAAVFITNLINQLHSISHAGFFSEAAAADLNILWKLTKHKCFVECSELSNLSNVYEGTFLK